MRYASALSFDWRDLTMHDPVQPKTDWVSRASVGLDWLWKLGAVVIAALVIAYTLGALKTNDEATLSSLAGRITAVESQQKLDEKAQQAMELGQQTMKADILNQMRAGQDAVLAKLDIAISAMPKSESVANLTLSLSHLSDRVDKIQENQGNDEKEAAEMKGTLKALCSASGKGAKC